jgi:hypothetical protein
MTLMVRSNDFKTLPVTGTVKVSTPNERLISALKKLGIFWGLGGICVFIPLAHFILVPTFVIAGMVAFFKDLQHTHSVQEPRFVCPSCLKQNSYRKTFYFHDEIRFYCTSCAEQLVLANVPN